MIFGGTDGQLRGNITNIEGEPLIGAQIFIQELGIGAVADIDGNYILLNIPVDSYDITVTMISYRTQIYKDVHIVMDNTVWLNFSLDVASNLSKSMWHRTLKILRRWWWRWRRRRSGFYNFLSRMVLRHCHQQNKQ